MILGWPIRPLLLFNTVLTLVVTVDQKQLEKGQQLRAQRDRAIADTDWLVLRHAEEATKTLSDEEYQKLLDYRQALRDWPKVAGWADNPMPSK